MKRETDPNPFDAGRAAYKSGKPNPYKMSTYPGSADNGAIDMEYTPERKVSDLDEKLAGIDEAIGIQQDGCTGEVTLTLVALA